VTLILRPAAAADVEEAFHWYEARRDGLGDEFLEVVQSGLDSIGSQPQASHVVHRDIRRHLSPRFPHALFYRLVEGELVVIACFHAKRHPRAWRSRR
jgi:plasmid stabilization system protein ParE